MLAQRLRLHIDPYYSPPADGLDHSPLSSSSPSFSFSPPVDMTSTTSRTPTSAVPEWRICFVLSLYDFSTSDPDHLPFQEGEILEIVKKEESGWWAALRDNRIGWVPSAFVRQLSDREARMLRDVKDEMRVHELDAVRLFNNPRPFASISSLSDTHSPDSATGHGHSHEPDEDSWIAVVEPEGKALFSHIPSSNLDTTDFPDDVVPLSGISPSQRSYPLPRWDSLEDYSAAKDSEPASSPEQSYAMQPITLPCPPSPATPMPHPHTEPSRPRITPLLINKPTPPTPSPPIQPSSSPTVAYTGPSLSRSRSESAPSMLAYASNRSAKRRPILLTDFNPLSQMSEFLDSPVSTFTLEMGFDPYGDNSTSVSRSPPNRRIDKVRQLTGDDDAQAFHNAKIAQARLPWYLQPSYSSDDIKLEYDGSVRAGTLAALVEKLTVEPLKMAQDIIYRRTFLTTFHTFTTAEELLELLIERYEMDHPANLTNDQFEEWKEKRMRPVQRRVLTVFTAWIEEHGLLQDDPQVVPRLRDFLSLIISPQSQAHSARLILQSLDRLSSAPVQSPISIVVTPSKRRRSYRIHKNDRDFLRHDPADLAQQLTLYEHRLYLKLRPKECLMSAKFQSNEKMANLNTFCGTHEKLASWVKFSILNNEGLGKRADTVDLWIKVAEKCRQLNNFSSTSAIIAALSSAVITRLHLTWVHVSRGSHMDQLVRLNEPTSNFSAYRTACSSVDGPCVPFIGIFLTDIVHIQDQFKDTVTFPLVPASSPYSPQRSQSVSAISLSSSTSLASMSSGPISEPRSSLSSTDAEPIEIGPSLINFVKRQKWFDTVNAIVRFQNKAHGFTENVTTMNYIVEQLAQAAKLEQSWFWTKSQELQQSEMAHADIRKGLEAAGF